MHPNIANPFPQAHLCPFPSGRIMKNKWGAAGILQTERQRRKAPRPVPTLYPSRAERGKVWGRVSLSPSPLEEGSGRGGAVPDFNHEQLHFSAFL